MKAVSHRGSQLRPPQAEKEACAKELQRHHARGHLEDRDLTLRLDLVEQAQTRGELRRLLADMPESRSLLRVPLGFRR
jgi:hypothetical protein